MRIHNGYEDIDLKMPVVTLGIFDGVHLGHRMLLDHLLARSKEVNGESVVITFHPHPRLVLDKNPGNLSFLSTMEEKTNLLEKQGIDHLIVIEFTKQFSEITACDFVEGILAGKIRSRHLIVGHDHHFGHHGEGNFRTIQNCAQSMGFKVEQVEGLKTGGLAVSSSIIRDALLKGNLSDANNWLGYDYSISGSVIEGKRIGRIIGFPTANIKPADKFKLIPCKGVYAVETYVNNSRLKGMLSIGTNPTINKTGGERSVEVNIFNFNGDIYGKNIEVVFRYRLRDEIAFDNTVQLVRQMELDRIKSLQLLG